MTHVPGSLAVPRIEAWSIEQPVSEAEFFRREIGLDIKVAPIDQIASQAAERPVLVVVSEARPYIEFVQQAPPERIVMLMISDESYSPERFQLVANQSAVRAIFRHYAIAPASITDVVASSWEFLRATSSTNVSPRLLPQLLVTGWRTRRRMNRWNELTVPVHAVPLGYTSEFAQALIDDLDLDIGPDDSLVQAARVEQSGRDRSIVFRGSAGTAQRQALVERARLQPDSDVAWIDAHWTSTPAHERASHYVQSLRRAKEALSPPGAVNTETFRYYEAALCGARPVEPRTALTHWGKPVARGGDPLDRILQELRDTRASLATAVADPLGGGRS